MINIDFLSASCYNAVRWQQKFGGNQGSWFLSRCVVYNANEMKIV